MTWNLQTTTANQTMVNPAHSHCAIVDEAGNGRTSMDAGHWHEVRNGQVLLDMRDRHDHKIMPGQQCMQAAQPLGQGQQPAPGQPGCLPCQQKQRTR